MQIKSTYCESRVNPHGLDVVYPRLSWTLASDVRGDGQSAYQIIVASSAALLAQNKGDLWNSGKQISPESTIAYQGRKLVSRQKCYWKVRVWDGKDKACEWTPSAQWSMGLLGDSDWKAQWITDPVLANSANFPRTPINCYRSETTNNQNQIKWVVLDLGKEQPLDMIEVRPARPNDWNADFESEMYPLRYKVEVATDADFKDAKTVVDHSNADVLNPRIASNVSRFDSVNARYVRLVVNKLGQWDVNLYGLALSGFNPYYKDKFIGQEATVSCSDSTESAQWSKKYLLPVPNSTQISADPAALGVAVKELDDVAARQRVSRVPTVRREFKLDKNIKSATLYVSARGFYQFDINGAKVSNQFLLPGFTDFNKRISYQCYDVTAMLKPGANALGAMLGYGWYAGHMNLFEHRNIYGHYPLLLAQLEVELADGQRVTIATDKSWKSTLNGPLLWSDLLDGEAIDQRRELTGWNKANYDDAAWSAAYATPLDATQLVWQRVQPTEAIRELKPAATKKIGADTYVFDFGQEIAGWCKLQLKGKAGAHIRVRHAELLKPDGDIDTSNLWGTAQQDDYILNSDQSVTLEPRFTYHGFRYAQVTGLSEEPKAGTIAAISMHNNIPETGEFHCSNPLYNQLMETAKWTQRNLMFDVPNGCAARSERLGWTGDLRPCVQALMFNMDSSAFLEKYAQDMRDEQTAAGQFTDIAPKAHLENTTICVGSPGWADLGVSLPWQMYVNYGNKRLLREHYAAARSWVEFINSHNPDFIWRHNRGQDWGDWLSAGPQTPRVIGSTAFYAHDADLLARMAGVLGYTADEAKYRQLFNNIKTAFASNFVGADGVITETKGASDDVQGSYALALHFELLDEAIRPKAVSRLTQLIEKNNGHLTTGFWSSIELMLSLSENGQHNIAAKMMNSQEQPSWGYMLKSGGTTYWESFDANTRNLSLNHWTYSSVGEWLWRYTAGLSPDENSPGYKHFTIAPHPVPEVNSCTATYNSVRGPIAIDWKQMPDEFTLDVTIPPGSTATLSLPSSGINKIEESGKPCPQAGGVKFITQQGDRTMLQAQSGTYKFRAKR